MPSVVPVESKLIRSKLRVGRYTTMTKQRQGHLYLTLPAFASYKKAPTLESHSRVILSRATNLCMEEQG